MSNTYTPTKWENNKTIATADVMNNMENGILDAHNGLKDVDSQIKEKANIVLIEQYKHLSNGQDYSNAFQYIIDNIADNVNQCTIKLEDNKEYIINAKIDKKYISVVGNATIKGLLRIGSSDIVSNSSYYDTFMHTSIRGIRFIGEGDYDNFISNTDYGLALKNCRSIEIKDCYFSNMMYPIKFESVYPFLTQHICRVRVVNCTFNVCGHVLYSCNIDDDVTTNNLYEIGDVEIRGCSCQAIKYESILINNVDGITCFENIFFHDELKNDTIIINCSCGVMINNNKIFEPGKSGIKINKVEDLIISNNHIYGSGYFDKSSAIYVKGVSLYDDSVIYALINNNILRKCYGAGIEIDCEDYVNGVNSFNINNNSINLNDTTNYKPVKTYGYCVGSLIANNISNGYINNTGFCKVSNNVTNNLISNYENGNMYTYFYNGEENLELVYPCDSLIKDTFGSKTIKILKTNYIDMYDGAKLIVYSEYGNTIIENNNLIKTKDGQNKVLKKSEVTLFVFVADCFVEV